MRRTITALLILIASGAIGGVNVWTTSGPGLAYVSRLIADPANPDILFAQTAAGIYRTTDGGATWSPVNSGLPNTGITAFMVAGLDAVTLYAAINGEVWSSADLGQHWMRSGEIEDAYVSDLNYDHGGTLYADASLQHPPFGTNLYTSSDAGTTWTAVLSDVNRWAISQD